MKREERRVYNGLKRLDTNGLINVEIKHEYSTEARQAMHEVLTIEKGLVAIRVCPSLLDGKPCTLYIIAETREQKEARKMQESMAEEYVVKGLPISEYAWNGYKWNDADAAAAEAAAAKKTAAEAAAKKAATEKRLQAMRDNLKKLEDRAEAILSKKENMTAADRIELLNIVNVAYHDSGKIEGIYSIDSTASCEFCSKMIKAAIDNILMICGACYAAADSWKEAAWRRHKLNARILSTVLFEKEELAILPVGLLCRYNEDGDTVNEIMARNYLRNAAAHIATMFGYWFKNSPAVEKALHAEGYHTRDMLPQNVRFIHSSALIGFAAAANWFDDGIFTVYPDAETTAAAIARGAHECNGKRCRACGFTCYMMQRQEKPLYIAEILRCSEKKRAIIRAAYDAKMQQQNAIA